MHVFNFIKRRFIEIKVGRNPYTDDEIKYLKENYETATWEDMLNHLPLRNKDSITHKAKNLGLVRRKVWSKQDIETLKNVYLSNLSAEEISVQIFNRKYTVAAIMSKASKLKLEKSAKWTEEELDLLFNYYPLLQPDQITEMLPRHSKMSIISKANNCGLVSIRYWNDNEIDYLLNHYSTQSDEEIAKHLNRTSEAVRGQRDRMKLYHPVEKCIYDNIADFLRKKVRPWRRKSIKQCGDACIITGNSDYDVHHLYGFNLILEKALETIDFPLKESFVDYSDEELDFLVDEFTKIHNSYPLGVCIDKNIHKEFHKMYGYGRNTPQQFYEFLQKKNIRIRNDYVLTQ